MSDQISAGERRELRSVVRSQMKALRAEVKQRENEMDADIEKRLIEKFRGDEARREELQSKVRKLTDDANQALDKLLDDYRINGETWRRGSGFHAPSIYSNVEKKAELRRALQAGLRAELRRAAVAIDRQEADLLRGLAVEALKTDAAIAFLDSILAVKVLAPTERILELEAQYEASR